MLAPTDPRYLDMTDEDILIEYEAECINSNEAKKTCPECKAETYRKHCPHCINEDGSPVGLSGDMVMDDIERRLERGEDVDIAAELGYVSPEEGEEFEPVPRGGSE